MRKLHVFLVLAMCVGLVFSSVSYAGNQLEGEKITLDLKDADIRNVIRMLSHKGNVNIVAGEEVKGTISLLLQNVGWEQALQTILDVSGYAYERKGNLIKVMTAEKMKKIKGEQLAIKETTKAEAELVTRIFSLNFADVEKLQKSVTKMLSSRGKIESDSRTNTLIVTDIQENIDQIAEIAQRLDIRTPQVLIEAAIIDVKITGQTKYGIDWDLEKVTGGTNIKMGTAKTEGWFSQGLTTTTGGLQHAITNYNIGQWNIGATLQWLRYNADVKILARPRLLVLDNQEANIEITESIPYTKITTNADGTQTSTTDFKEVGTYLTVKPHITNDGFVSMLVKPKHSFSVGEYSSEPIIDSRSLETSLLTKDGRMVIVGGLRRNYNTITVYKVPILGDIPLLGYLFKKNTTEKTRMELIILITPTIVTEETELTEDEKASVQKMDETWEKTNPDKKLPTKIWRGTDINLNIDKISR
ncbi:MAG: type IV pilus secretin PilQ [bacterium]|nr:type IV pilus secretin PilQ [bacterium]